MDYTSTLDFLKNLLSQNQTTQAGQFGQSLGFNQQQLGERSNEFSANLALQKVIADWQNQLANRAQAQSEQAQQFGQNLTTRNTSIPYMQTQASIASANSPSGQAATQSWLSDFLSRIAANQSAYGTQNAVPSFSAPLTSFRNYGTSGLLSLGLQSPQPAPILIPDKGNRPTGAF